MTLQGTPGGAQLADSEKATRCANVLHRQATRSTLSVYTTVAALTDAQHAQQWVTRDAPHKSCAELRDRCPTSHVDGESSGHWTCASSPQRNLHWSSQQTSRNPSRSTSLQTHHMPKLKRVGQETHSATRRAPATCTSKSAGQQTRRHQTARSFPEASSCAWTTTARSNPDAQRYAVACRL